MEKRRLEVPFENYRLNYDIIIFRVEKDNLCPNKKELEALNLFYNRFNFLFDEIVDERFCQKDAIQRFTILREISSVYKELSNYEPIKYYLKWMKLGGRPVYEGIIADDLFSFIRNLLFHFPLFDTWDQVYINENLATWSKVGQIDKFLRLCTKIKIDGKGTINYRLWDSVKKEMTYFSVNFPQEYNAKNIYLKDIISEKPGILLCVALMRNILDVQLVDPGEERFKIM